MNSPIFNPKKQAFFEVLALIFVISIITLLLWVIFCKSAQGAQITQPATLTISTICGPAMALCDTASRPVVVDGFHLFFGPEEITLKHFVPCDHALQVTIIGAEGTTNELMWSPDLTNWFTTNLRFVTRATNEAVYFIREPEQARFYKTVQR